MNIPKQLIFVGFLILALVVSAGGATYENIGTYGNWATEWTPIVGTNDPDDGLKDAHLDYVGDRSNPAGYWATNGTYLFFRMRINDGDLSSNPFSDAHLISINILGQNMGITKHLVAGPDDGVGDYAFSWDSKSKDSTNHGLEIGIRSARGALIWGDVAFDNIAGESNTVDTGNGDTGNRKSGNGDTGNRKKDDGDKDDRDKDLKEKAINDINGDGRTEDGYIRTIDSQSTTNFGMTSFIEMAVSFAYLEAYTEVDFWTQEWEISFASIANDTANNSISADVSGWINTDGLVTTGWTPVPEPATLALFSVGGMALLRRRRRK